jgi:hypothetical protein
MERMLETLEVTIPAGRTLRIRNARGTTIRVLEGGGWITEQDDTEDYVLEAGDQRTVGTAGVTLVHALRTARMAVSGHAAVELGGGYREYAAAVWSGQVAAVARAAGRKMKAWSLRFRGQSAIPTIPMPIPSKPASGSRHSMP